MRWGSIGIALLAWVGCFASLALAQNDSESAPSKPLTYADIVAADEPVVWFSMSDWASRGSAELTKPTTQGKVNVAESGPRPITFPLFATDNTAAEFSASAIRVADPGDKSPLDFDLGDAITIEAWVYVKKLANGQQSYIVGKGRTGLEGQAADNQNYGLRVNGESGRASLSFLFRSSDNRRGTTDDWHRWNTTSNFTIGAWHHVAVSYVFGKPDSIRGYIDGKPSKGTWDYGGPSAEGPVVDNDELWIGSAQGTAGSNSFTGLIDEVAIYRCELPAERIAARFQMVQPDPYLTNVPVPAGKVLVEVFEGIPDAFSWDFIHPSPSERFTIDQMAAFALPNNYNRHGVRVDRGNPHVAWMTSDIDFTAGKHRLLVRSRSGARLFIDGKLVGENPFSHASDDGHHPYLKPTSKVSPSIRVVQPGDRETLFEVELEEGTHRVQLQLHMGGKKRRPELGEASLTVAPMGSDDFVVVAPDADRKIPLTDEGYLAFEAEQQGLLASINRTRRQQSSAEYAKYWDARHDYAREYLRSLEPIAIPALEGSTDIDRLVASRLTDSKLTAAPRASDESFVRRLYLDVLGITPTAAEVERFLADTRDNKRSLLIDHLLQQPGWADHWMGYWQDVLAENPNIVNPTLNNTGPFRWWLYEALSDNRPLDRFTTELILMEGSDRYGGPGGFAVASQNDAPLAAKAHVLAGAMLAINLNCARCHDAPFHEWKQKDLFNLAAMLGRGTQTLPKTSTIPGDPAALKSLVVKVTLKPGEKIEPGWPFVDHYVGELKKELLESPGDTREQLAVRITSPHNTRFAKVLANRFWHRYIGRGIIEPVDDWEQGDNVHPELLEFLARKLIESGYDAKSLARLILNSDTYQREPTSSLAQSRLFAAPMRRRMTAEQVLDSMYSVAGKRLNVEELNIDVDGTRNEAQSISLGIPDRGWQFTSLSNERDRPSLSLPGAQNMINVLEAFGWRGSRQDPMTMRESEPAVIQPATLANGVAAKRIAQLSEDSRFTLLALEDQPIEKFVEQVFVEMLARKPTAAESAIYVELLTPGYSERRTGKPAGPMPKRIPRDGVSWSNHLSNESNQVRIDLQKQLEAGDPPTTRLTADWRERAEDMVWILLNTPEFVFVP
ncbi:protein of unknown function DUF1549 [Pirellula staleyi DSM 6068]|uniref:PA14 domain-containing protein n=1 Tax=Pirellula staleyi (strain ATCC 27377 / DSM 6068 / ICPB 4128) TaxID=530564 RepID=D2R2C9_PIRSD|nr:DUF1553 domain-containing protein [Pirellula staleyi]ADB15038.1 protein of unknown function DUF1549 [Pirellula staleyi DSM 6068]